MFVLDDPKSSVEAEWSLHNSGLTFFDLFELTVVVLVVSSGMCQEYYRGLVLTYCFNNPIPATQKVQPDIGFKLLWIETMLSQRSILTVQSHS